MFAVVLQWQKTNKEKKGLKCCLFTAALEHHVWCIHPVLPPLNQYQNMPKTFSFFLYWDHSNNVYSAFFSLPAYFLFFALELFLLSCFMNVLTVTSPLIWQMNTASSTNRFQSRVFVFVASFCRNQSIRNGTTLSNCDDTFWLSEDTRDAAAVAVLVPQNKMLRMELGRRRPSRRVRLSR